MRSVAARPRNEKALRSIIREESRYGSLQAHLMLMGYDKATIVDNEVIEHIASEAQTTPLLESNYKKDKRKDFLIKGVVLGALFLMVVFDLVDINIVRLLMEVVL